MIVCPKIQRSLTVKGHTSNVSPEQCTKIDQFAPEKTSVFNRCRSFNLGVLGLKDFQSQGCYQPHKAVITCYRIHSSF